MALPNVSNKMKYLFIRDISRAKCFAAFTSDFSHRRSNSRIKFSLCGCDKRDANVITTPPPRAKGSPPFSVASIRNASGSQRGNRGTSRHIEVLRLIKEGNLCTTARRPKRHVRLYKGSFV